MALEWKVWYSDKLTYDSDQGAWEAGRPAGIVCVATLDPSEVWGRFILHKFEYYYKIFGTEIVGGNVKALIKVHVPGILDSWIKRGGNAWKEDYYEILNAATRDPAFPTGSPRRRSTDWQVNG